MGLLDDPIVSVEIEHTRSTEAKANRLLKGTKIRRAKRKKHKRKIPTMPYRVYIKSKYWRKRKNDYFGKYGKKCAVCSKKFGVTLHHKRYNVKLGEEPDDALVPLCQTHHQEFHSIVKTKLKMVKETDDYIQNARQLQTSNIDDLSWIV